MSLTPGASHGDVQFIDLALALGVFQLPHPLLGNDVDFGRVGRRRALLEKYQRAPYEDDHEDEEGNRAPGNFEGVRTFDLFGADTGTMAVTGGEIDEQGKNQQGHGAGNENQENVERIHVARQRGGSFRP